MAKKKSKLSEATAEELVALKDAATTDDQRLAIEKEEFRRRKPKTKPKEKLPPIEKVTVELPWSELRKNGYGVSTQHIPSAMRSRHRLTPKAGKALAHLQSATRQMGLKLSSGAPVESQEHVIQWVLEQFAEAKTDEKA